MAEGRAPNNHVYRVADRGQTLLLGVWVDFAWQRSFNEIGRDYKHKAYWWHRFLDVLPHTYE